MWIKTMRTPGTSWARARALLIVIAAASLVGASAASAVGSSHEDDDVPSSSGAALRLVTKQIAPGVERVIRDRAGHDLRRKYPTRHRDMDHIAIAPDGTPWISSTASGPDNEFLRGPQIWPLGQTGLYGQKAGVPDGVGRLAFTDDGNLWATGDRPLMFDGQEWTRPSGSNKATTSDGRLWIISRGVLESWDGSEFEPALPGTHVVTLIQRSDGSLMATGHESLAEYDGASWTVSDLSRRSVTAADGSTWEAPGRSVQRTLGDESSTLLKGVRIDEIALAPDGSIWAIGNIGRNSNGGVYRIDPVAVAASAVETAESQPTADAASDGSTDTSGSEEDATTTG